MRYCVIENTTKIIDGSNNPVEIMKQNALNSGISNFEILSSEEYQARKSIEQSKKQSQEVGILKSKLAESDYMIIKCYEYQLAGKETPYNLEALHRDRQAMRDKINQLER